MKKENKKIKIDKKVIVIIGVIVIAAIIIPHIAHAGLADSIAKAIFKFFANIILSICGFFVDLAGKFFEAMLNIGFKKQAAIAKIGWTVVRDFSNMLFILFMVIIAFGTILRIERYGARQLLPKLIIIALLINFSMIICYVIIDFSNLTADYFIQSAKQISNGAKGGIGGALADSMNLGKLLTPSNCDDFTTSATDCNDSEMSAQEKQECLDSIQTQKAECEKTAAAVKAASSQQNLMDIIVSAVFGGIVMLIAGFTLLAGAILLIIRIVFIWFLVMVSPFVFICYLLPALKSNWDKWWKNLLSWCFFAPAYAFFIWLAVRISTQYKKNYIEGLLAAAKGSNSGVVTGFFTTGDTILYFAFTIAILLGGLIAAKSFGLYGANTAMTIGKKWGKGIAARTTRYPKEIGTAIGAGTMQQLGKTLKNVPGLGRFGRNLEARGTALYRKPAENKLVKDYEKRAELMADPDLLKEIKSQTGVLSLTAVQVASKRGLLQKTEDRDAVGTGINMLRGYGYAKDAGDLEEARFSVIKGDQERKKTIKKIKAKGTDKDLRDVVFKGAIGQQAAEDYILDEPSISSVVERVHKLRRDTQAQLGTSLIYRFINNNKFDANNMKLRSAYAAITGNLRTAFWDRQNKRIDRTALGNFTKDLKPTDFTEIDKYSIKEIAEFVSAATAVDASRSLSEEKKRILISEWGKIAATVGHPKAQQALDTLKDLKQRAAWASLVP